MSKLLLHTLKGFGFESLQDLGQSLMHMCIGFTKIAKIGVVLGTVATVIETFIGLTPMAYLAFILLIGLEFFTGLKASLKQGKKIQSRKFGRMIVKIAAYTITLGIIHIFKTQLTIPEIFGYGVNIYEWFYYVILNMILVQLIISVIENFSRMGLMEANKLLIVIKRQINKWFDLDVERD